MDLTELFEGRLPNWMNYFINHEIYSYSSNFLDGIKVFLAKAVFTITIIYVIFAIIKSIIAKDYRSIWKHIIKLFIIPFLAYYVFYLGLEVLIVNVIMLISLLFALLSKNLSDAVSILLSVGVVDVVYILFYPGLFFVISIIFNFEATTRKPLFLKHLEEKGKHYDKNLSFVNKSDSYCLGEITKIIFGNRGWLEQARIGKGDYIPLDTLVVAEFENPRFDLSRPIGSLVTINREVLKKHQQLKEKNGGRNSQKRKDNPPAFWELVDHSVYDRSHTIPQDFSLDEGETKGLTFTGTKYLNNGNADKLGINFEYEKYDDKHNRIVDLLFEYHKNCLNTTGQNQIDNIPIVIDFKYLHFVYDELIKNPEFDMSVFRINESREKLHQVSTMHIERLANRIINYYQQDEFIYSCELLYSSPSANLVHDVELMLYNRTQNRIEFRFLLGNIEY